MSQRREKRPKKAILLHLDEGLYTQVLRVSNRDGIPVVAAIHVLLSAALRRDLDVITPGATIERN